MHTFIEMVELDYSLLFLIKFSIINVHASPYMHVANENVNI